MSFNSNRKWLPVHWPQFLSVIHSSHTSWRSFTLTDTFGFLSSDIGIRFSHRVLYFDFRKCTQRMENWVPHLLIKNIGPTTSLSKRNFDGKCKMLLCHTFCPVTFSILARLYLERESTVWHQIYTFFLNSCSLFVVKSAPCSNEL